MSGWSYGNRCCAAPRTGNTYICSMDVAAARAVATRTVRKGIVW